MTFSCYKSAYLKKTRMQESLAAYYLDKPAFFKPFNQFEYGTYRAVRAVSEAPVIILVAIAARVIASVSNGPLKAFNRRCLHYPDSEAGRISDLLH